MAIQVGDKVPAATLGRMGKDGAETVDLADELRGRKVVLFGLPGAFTGTCSSAHLPSFIRTADDIRANGVEAIICVSVNDLFVMAEWAKSSGAEDAGLTMLADPKGDYARALGLQFDAPPVGLYGRLERHAMVVEDGVITSLDVEEPGVCTATAGEAVLAKL